MIIISPMRKTDCDSVYELQSKCFSLPWSAESIREMFKRPGYYNLVARETFEKNAWIKGNELSEETIKKTVSEASEDSVDKTGREGCEEKRIIGYIGILAVLDEADITNVAVDPACRRNHVATSLLAQLIKDTEKLGIRRIYLEVRESNQAAIRLYEKAGFILSGRRQNYYEKPTEDALLMVRGNDLSACSGSRA